MGLHQLHIMNILFPFIIKKDTFTILKLESIVFPCKLYYVVLSLSLSGKDAMGTRVTMENYNDVTNQILKLL